MQLLTKFLVGWLANVAALWVADRLLGGVEIAGWRPLLIAGAVLALLSAFLRPLLVLLSLPLVILTLGLFLLVINIAVLALTDVLVRGFEIEGLLTYVVAVLIVWLVNAAVDRIGVRG
ncbi:MAG TPA: phage holin family protein [Gaiellaceae bacterium]|nr:phage holin family protein [Gaiellaceae bacterium]